MRRVLISCLLASIAFVAAAAPATAAPPPIKHVFIIALENKGYDATFGPSSQAEPEARSSRLVREPGSTSRITETVLRS